MTDRAPIETKNLDIYGNAALPWSRAHDQLSVTPTPIDFTYFLGTVRPDSRPHATGIGATWHDGDFYITSNPKARKARNLAANPACTLSVRLEGIDVVMEGEATRITDQATLERIVKEYRDGGWPVEVQGDALTAPFSAPSAGKPPYYLYRFTFHTAFGVATKEPNGATRWRFT